MCANPQPFRNSCNVFGAATTKIRFARFWNKASAIQEFLKLKNIAEHISKNKFHNLQNFVSNNYLLFFIESLGKALKFLDVYFIVGKRYIKKLQLTLCVTSLHNSYRYAQQSGFLAHVEKGIPLGFVLLIETFFQEGKYIYFSLNFYRRLALPEHRVTLLPHEMWAESLMKTFRRYSLLYKNSANVTFDYSVALF